MIIGEQESKRRLPEIMMFQEMDLHEEILERLNSLDKDTFGEFNYVYELISK